MKITINIEGQDGQKCGEESNLKEDSQAQETMAKNHNQAETFLKTFKERVDPLDFLQYLTRFKEKDEVSDFFKIFLISFW